MKNYLLIITSLLLCFFTACKKDPATRITGTWKLYKAESHVIYTYNNQDYDLTHRYDGSSLATGQYLSPAYTLTFELSENKTFEITETHQGKIYTYTGTWALNGDKSAIIMDDDIAPADPFIYGFLRKGPLDITLLTKEQLNIKFGEMFPDDNTLVGIGNFVFLKAP